MSKHPKHPKHPSKKGHNPSQPRETIQTPAQRQESSRISRGPGSANQMILDGSLQGWCALAGSTLLNVEPQEKCGWTKPMNYRDKCRISDKYHKHSINRIVKLKLSTHQQTAIFFKNWGPHQGRPGYTQWGISGPLKWRYVSNIYSHILVVNPLKFCPYIGIHRPYISIYIYTHIRILYISIYSRDFNFQVNEMAIDIRLPRYRKKKEQWTNKSDWHLLISDRLLMKISLQTSVYFWIVGPWGNPI